MTVVQLGTERTETFTVCEETIEMTAPTQAATHDDWTGIQEGLAREFLTDIMRHMPSMEAIVAFLAALVAALTAILAPAPASAASTAPHWSLITMPTPTNFVPGDSAHKYTYDVRAANVGAANTDGGPITITDTLPQGVEVKGVQFKVRYSGEFEGTNGVEFGTHAAKASYELCEVSGSSLAATVTCELPEEFPAQLQIDHPPTEGTGPSLVVPEEEVRMTIEVAAPAGTPPGPLTNQAAVTGGGAPDAEVSSHNQVTSEEDPQPAAGGFSFFKTELNEANGEAARVAGGRPYSFTTNFAVNTKFAIPGNVAEFVPAGGDLKDIPVALPPGLVGNPNVATKCTAQQFNSTHTVSLKKGVITTRNACPASSQVGIARVQQVEGQAGQTVVPIYNLAPAPGEPAEFGFQVLSVPIYIDTEARPEDDYKIVAGVRNNTQAKRVTAASVTFWGTPGDPLHAPYRGECMSTAPLAVPFSICDAPSFEEEGLTVKPFFRLPTSCPGTPLAISMSFNTWTNPGEFISQTSSSPAVGGCGPQVPFEPTLETRPTTNVSDSPTGLHAHLHIPQPEECEPGEPEESIACSTGEADLRKTVVTLPEGLVINPSGANGLGACSESQVGYLRTEADGTAIFSNDAAQCPDDAKIGTVEVDTPLIDHPLKGAVYAATPHANPFDSLLAIYLAVDDPVSGIVVKLAGEVKPDPTTGRLTTTFDMTPQTPFEDFKLDFFEGAAAPLRTPATCGTKQTKSLLRPWSWPAGGEAESIDTYSVSQSPGGGTCPTNPADLSKATSFHAGTEAPIAGDFSPLVMNLKRDDGSQEFSQLTLNPPPGLIGRLAGISICSPGALTTAEGKSGNEEKAHPSCPTSSEVGTVTAGAGAGPAPYFTTGKVYLMGPYKGAPLGLAIITPAAAGPYDLGTVVVRTALYIDPETAKVTAVSDPIPHILQGIPLDVRSVSVKIDRPDFTLNPTNCDAMAFNGALVTVLGQTSSLEDHFQVGECGRLGFKPRLRLALRGGTRRAKNPKLVATVTARKGDANLSRVSVQLPRSAFLDQSHIRTICTRVQWAAEACPPGSIYGRASVKTPLFDYEISGNVYLRSSNHKLPDLIIDLRGPDFQPIRIDLDGRTDSVKGALRNTFDVVPDAPFETARVVLFGGKRGLVVNSRNICARKYRATVKIKGQNGRVFNTRPVVRNDCGKAKHRKHRRHHRRSR